MRGQATNHRGILSLCHLVTLSIVWPLLSVVAAGATPPALEHDPVVVTMRPVADVTGVDVLVADIAEIRGGDVQLREKIAGLDLTEAPRTGQTVVVTAHQLSCRIRVAGIDPRQYVLQGTS